MFGSHKEIACKAGEWTTIIHTSFAQLPMSWTIGLLDGAPNALGEYEETKSSWIFPGKPLVERLRADTVFNRGYWNTFYKVRIRPSGNIVISVDRHWT
jgi:hypothetical protein